MTLEFRGVKYEANTLILKQIEKIEHLTIKMLAVHKKRMDTDDLAEWDRLSEELDPLYTAKLKTVFGDKWPDVKRGELLDDEVEALESFFDLLRGKKAKKPGESIQTSPGSTPKEISTSSQTDTK